MLFKEFIFISDSKDKKSKTKKELYFFSSIFSKRIAYLLYKSGISADLTTFLFGFAGLISSIFYFYNYHIIGYFFWRLHVILDLADGDIARVTKYNPLGRMMDKFQHIIINLTLFPSLFLSKNYFISDENNIKLFITLLPLFLIYFTFSFMTSNLGFDNYPKYKKNLLTILLKNSITFEGLILFSTLIFIFKDIGTFIPDNTLGIILIFYNISFLAIVIKKLSLLKDKA